MTTTDTLFGSNKIGPLLLATLGLTTGDVGRYRDCFIHGDSEIAVYTRNGGGNRACWHKDSDWYGNKGCKHESRVELVNEVVWATEDEAKAHPEWKPLNVCGGGKRQYATGGKVEEEQYRCLEPDSAECSCPGCTINYRLPQHPCYLRDEDDEFDSTYATIYFRFPDEWADELKRLATGEKFDPDARWQAMLERLSPP